MLIKMHNRSMLDHTLCSSFLMEGKGVCGGGGGGQGKEGPLNKN